MPGRLQYAAVVGDNVRAVARRSEASHYSAIRSFRSRTLLRLMVSSIFLACGAMSPSSGQDIDTLITGQTPSRTTVFDEVKDPHERRALLAIYKQQNPGARIKLAQSFLQSYPRSSFLAEVYQVIAKAQIETGDYRSTLENAAKSLRLYPEDALLAVSVADVQAHQGLYPQAESSAETALDLLTHFVNPASVSSRDWAKLKPQLQASCYFSLGRAQMMQALVKGNDAGRNQRLEQALGNLDEAARLNPRDDEVSYLQGLAELALGDLHPAEVYFARVTRLEGSLRSKALEQLRRLYEHSTDFNRVPFETYVKSIPEPPMSAEAKDDAKSAARSPELPPYAGSKACRQCHPDVYERWSQTGMARMLRPYAAANVIGDFSRGASVDAGEVDAWKNGQLITTPALAMQPAVRMSTDHGNDYFEIKDAAGNWHRYRVDYTIGSKWEQAYATRLPNGEIHVFPVQYNAMQKRWVDFWQIIDPPGSPRAQVTQWPRLDSWSSYQANCAVCHTSQLRNLRGGGFETLGPEFREPGINCEMCHGPSLKHVEAMQKAQPYDKRPIDPPVDFARIEPRQFVAICAQCHMQSAVRNPGPDGELNYSRSGEFFMRHQRRPYNVFSRKGFYKDGRFRETTFFVESLLRTRCFRKGHATCGSCHDPHPANPASNPNSMKFSDQPDEMCVQCHTEYREERALTRHTHHAYSSQGSRCVSCHMPRIVDALLFEARSHEFDQIPDVQMTLTFGQEESPNACQICHDKETTEWVMQTLRAWRAPAKPELTGRNEIFEDEGYARVRRP